uniref:4Fe-4S dicluster domain-containing protein n=1 Tax=Streptomyces sp. NBC_00003 TaxID=2903608 RepID=A0AAU2UXJ2_9ACTN
MTTIGATAVVDRQGLQALVAALVAGGRTVVGPTVRDGAIVLAELDSAEQLPYGWGVELEAGHYRLRRREDGAAFAHSAGPQSWKNFLHPQREKLCTEPGATCFCVSMGTGPGADSGFDLALTEVVDDAGHRFYVRVGSEEGATLLDALPSREADGTTANVARAVVAGAVDKMGRSMPPVDLHALMGASLEAERWDDVASRCRYRQWLTHKLGTWHDQFNSSGCVGCGRCIVWCPVGIDITEEVTALKEEAER